MSSDDMVVTARGLRKAYRLYASPVQRFLDLFGLLRGGEALPQHVALGGVDLDIRRGEKVALIGRNGAGKSTLLKLITGVIQPTAGVLTVNSNAHALLQIGSGFFPEFTGRQNVLSYLAHMGVSGAQAAHLVDEVIEFSELEEYADQPIKTYSTGMVARLMFAASTIHRPELLVLDEILGVGDGYFAQKSFERIREMCEGGHTTVLLVSHDIYSASRLCDRMIWLDAGRIVIDDRAPVVIRAYEDSIRVQEEARLRRRSQLRLAELRRASAGTETVRIEIRSRDNAPLAGPAHVAAVEVAYGGERYAADLTEDDLVQAGECWGGLVNESSQRCREMRDHGSLFRRASVPVTLPAGSLRDGREQLRVHVRYLSKAENRLELSIYDSENRYELGPLPVSGGRWVDHEASIVADRAAGSGKPDQQSPMIFGTGDIYVTDMRLRDGAGSHVFHVRHGHSATLEFDYEIRRQGLDETADVLVSFYRDGVHEACKYFTSGLRFGEARGREGTVSMKIDRLPLPNGKYVVTLMLAKGGYYASNPSLYFSINPDVYSCLSRYLEFEVYGGDLVASGTGLVEAASWTIGDRKGAAS